MHNHKPFNPFGILWILDVKNPQMIDRAVDWVAKIAAFVGLVGILYSLHPRLDMPAVYGQLIDAGTIVSVFAYFACVGFIGVRCLGQRDPGESAMDQMLYILKRLFTYGLVPALVLLAGIIVVVTFFSLTNL